MESDTVPDSWAYILVGNRGEMQNKQKRLVRVGETPTYLLSSSGF